MVFALVLSVVMFIFVLVRTLYHLYFYEFGVKTTGRIVASKQVAVLKNRSVYGEYIDKTEYVYEYTDEWGTKHIGVLGGLYSDGTYQEGMEIPITYLRRNPKRVSTYTKRDWFRFEFMALVAAAVVFSIFLLEAYS